MYGLFNYIKELDHQMADYEQRDLSDELWIKLESLLTGKANDWVAVTQDNRQFLSILYYGY